MKPRGTINSAPSLRDIIHLPLEKWKDNLFNDFETSVFSIHPNLVEIKNTLYHEGAIYAAMSGSGSAIFGIFKSKPGLKNKFPGMYYYET